MRHYAWRLPHWDSVGEPLFVTFRLYGMFPPEQLTSGKAFVAMDRLLDHDQRRLQVESPAPHAHALTRCSLWPQAGEMACRDGPKLAPARNYSAAADILTS